jgi:hypothetical protein
MQPKKKSLSLNRETIRRLTDSELSDVHGGFEIPTRVGCPSRRGCPSYTCSTYYASCFDSCWDSDCCLQVP